MSKVKQFQLIILAVSAVSILFPVVGQASTEKNDTEKRVDRITIELAAGLSKDEMPAVGFLHDLHARALDGKCTACHVETDKAIVFKFKRAAEPASVDLYHDNCIACHEEKKAAGEIAGPLAAECRACHGQEKQTASSWKPIPFDKSLHYTHEISKQIKSPRAEETDNCSQCHHKYNEKTKEIYAAKGEEESCFYCHKPSRQNEIRPIREAAHDSCVKCHQTLKAQKGEAGPVNCDGCHDKEKQLQIKKNADIPRLKRNQPDEVAITGWKTTPPENKHFMNAVAFDHKSHEANTQSCKVCHHETLKKCNDCHGTAGGEQKGGFVSLEQAMHKQNSTRSCVGCHAEATKTQDCAGCHFQMPADRTNSQTACITCHTLSQEKLASMEPGKAAKMALMDLSANYKPVKADQIPETIVIDILADEYKASSFPHRKVVQAITQRVEKSEMAKVFHTDQAGLCMGCHHNTPKTLEPPRCASCHSKNGPAADGRPGLKGAYHGQCITCHQKMKVETVLATDCVKCHEQKK